MALPSPPDNCVDVLIIGAGPAGLMCANALVHAGVKVRIVDKKYVLHFFPYPQIHGSIVVWYRAVPVSVGHADGIHPRTTEVLQVVNGSPRTDTFFLTLHSLLELRVG